MTLGDRVGRATNSSHRPNGSAESSRDDKSARTPAPDPPDPPRPAFGPEPPHADQTGPTFPPGGAAQHAEDSWPNADDFWSDQQPSSDYWYAQPTDPFGGADSGTWTDEREPWNSENPLWAEQNPPPANGSNASPPPPPPKPEPEPSPAEDEVLPPSGTADAPKQEVHPLLTVAALQPATIKAIGSAPEPVRRVGPPPSTANVAAVMSGLLAVPMLATAGALFGTGTGMALPAVLLVLTVGCIAGGVRLIARGSPLLALFNAVVALATTVGVLWFVPRGLTTALLSALWLLFLPVVLVMVALLRTKKVRRWLIARSRHWQASRPPAKRRRLRLPEIHISLPKLARRNPTRRKTRKPTTVRREGRHKRQRRSFLRRGPVSYVGDKAPEDT